MCACGILIHPKRIQKILCIRIFHIFVETASFFSQSYFQEETVLEDKDYFVFGVQLFTSPQRLAPSQKQLHQESKNKSQVHQNLDNEPSIVTIQDT